ncbi:hypothetical protein [Nocardia sp. IFM 10818]
MVADTYCATEFWWGEVSAGPDEPASLEYLDQLLTDLGYDRVSGWRHAFTASGAERYFADAVTQSHLDGHLQ